MSLDDIGLTSSRRRMAVVALLTTGLVFDGFDLVVYGAIVPTLLRDPSQIGALDARMAGLLGSCALFGVLIGALLSGTLIDRVGRRRVLLVSYAWFGVGMLATAVSESILQFGALRFLTGLGVGGVLATTGALVAENAPPARRNLYTAIAYSGVPLGSLLAALAAMVLAEHLGWRGLMALGALPLITLLPLAYFLVEEPKEWLASRTNRNEPAVSRLDQTAARPSDDVGYRGLFRHHLTDAVLIGLMSAIGLLLVYALNTWLPELMLRAGAGASQSLAILMILNGGAIGGAILGAYLADRGDPRRIVAATFATAALSIPVLTLGLDYAAIIVFVAAVGVGTSGTQILVYGLSATRFPVQVRGAGVSWCAGFGRLGGVGGPLVCGLLLEAGLSMETVLRVLAVAALLGLTCALIMRAKSQPTAATRTM